MQASQHSLEATNMHPPPPPHDTHKNPPQTNTYIKTPHTLTVSRNSKQLTRICTRRLSLFSARACCAMLLSMLSRLSSQLARHREPKEGPKA